MAIHYGSAPVKFDRIRRITGYLVGRLERFNDAKKKEVADRVVHEFRPLRPVPFSIPTSAAG